MMGELPQLAGGASQLSATLPRRDLPDLHRRSITLFGQFLPYSNRLHTPVAWFSQHRYNVLEEGEEKCIVSKRILGPSRSAPQE